MLLMQAREESVPTDDTACENFLFIQVFDIDNCRIWYSQLGVSNLYAVLVKVHFHICSLWMDFCALRYISCHMWLCIYRLTFIVLISRYWVCQTVLQYFCTSSLFRRFPSILPSPFPLSLSFAGQCRTVVFFPRDESSRASPADILNCCATSGSIRAIFLPTSDCSASATLRLTTFSLDSLFLLLKISTPINYSL